MKIKFLKRTTLLIAAMCLLLAGCGKEKPADWNSFANGEHLSDWQQGAENPESSELGQLDPLPWDEGGAGQPANYTWEEYEALTDDQKLAFQEHLSLEGFVDWLKRAADVPWTAAGAKQPVHYTADDYQALTEAQKLAFWYELGADGFDAWLEKSQVQTEPNPWDAPGAKQPADYTWAEFEALTEAQQIAFQSYLGTSGFDAWMGKSQVQTEPNPWDTPGAKQPAAYTWAEFEALTEAQQIAFQSHLGSEGFDAWMAQEQEPGEANPWDAPGAKQPADYTWAEFEALTEAQQIAFQSHLGADGFDAWMAQEQEPGEANPWDAPGAKQPAAYTWAEFEALTGAQQMAFQAHLGSDGFDAWWDRVQGEDTP